VIPAFYLISNSLKALSASARETQEIALRDALSIHPLAGVLITDPADGELAYRFHEQVLLQGIQVRALAADLADKVGPVAIIGAFPNLLTAVHADGTEEVIPCSY
jgi:hypothetical protein